MIDVAYIQQDATYIECVRAADVLRRLVFGWDEIVPEGRYRLYNGLGETVGEVWLKEEGLWKIQALQRARVLSSATHSARTKHEAFVTTARLLTERFENLIWRGAEDTAPSRAGLLMSTE